MPGKSAIVLVHGVGHADTGSTIEALLAGDANSAEVGQFSTLQIGKYKYTQATMPSGVSLFESNWSEARPLQSTGPKILLEALLLVLGMLQVLRFDLAEPKDRKPFLPGRIFKLIFLGVFFWSIHPPIVSMFVSAGLFLPAAAWLVVLTASVWWFQRYDKDFRVGFFWVAYIVFLWAAHAWEALPDESVYVHLSTWPYVGAQLLTIAAGWVMIAIIWFRLSFRSSQSRNVRLAFVYIPYFVASCVGAVVWVVALSTARYFSADSLEFLGSWPNYYSKALGYSVFNAERFNGLLTMICGLLLLVPFVSFLLARKSDPENSAVKARIWFDRVLWLLPIILLCSVPAFCFFVLSAGADTSESAHRIWQAYTIWSVRILAFLPFLLGGLAIVLKAAGDVLYYLCPQTDLISVRRQAVNKLRTLVRHLLNNDYDVLILSHSQGTILALDVCDEFPGQLSVWISGSPSDALYYRYLDIDRIEGLDVRDFKNFYRHDDLIAGRVRLNGMGGANVSMGLGGHTNYWKEFKIKDLAEATGTSPSQCGNS